MFCNKITMVNSHKYSCYFFLCFSSFLHYAMFVPSCLSPLFNIHPLTHSLNCVYDKAEKVFNLPTKIYSLSFPKGCIIWKIKHKIEKKVATSGQKRREWVKWNEVNWSELNWMKINLKFLEFFQRKINLLFSSASLLLSQQCKYVCGSLIGFHVCVLNFLNNQPTIIK